MEMSGGANNDDIIGQEAGSASTNKTQTERKAATRKLDHINAAVCIRNVLEIN